MPSFDSANYLRGLGWSGPGSSLNNDPSGRSKPITVAQKKTLAGVGRDRDTAFPWWEMVFSSVAGKVGTTTTKKTGSKVDHHRTSTGILSHRPPPAKSTAYESLEKKPRTGGGGLNMDAMAIAKLEMARRQLYSGFTRGTKLSGSVEEEEEEEEASEGEDENDEENMKKRKRDSSADDSSSSEELEDRDELKKRKKQKKLDKKLKKEAKAEKRRLKEEKRAAKEAKRKGKGKASNLDQQDADSDTVIEVESTTTTFTTATPIESDSPSTSSSLSSKAERKAAKKLKKSLLSIASTPPVSADTLSTPEDAAVLEEKAYQEAKAAAKKAQKEEKRLAKIAKKVAKETEADD